MHSSPYHYFPVTAPFLAILFLLFIVLLVLVQLGILEYAYAKIGVQPRYVFLVLTLSFLGSYINIPVRSSRKRTSFPTRRSRITGCNMSSPKSSTGPRR